MTAQAGLDGQRVVQLVAYGATGPNPVLGSGYLVGPGLVLTCAHALHHAAEITVRTVVGRGLEAQAGAEVVWIDTDRHVDLAVLRLTAGQESGFPSGVPPTRFGRVEGRVECEAAGFPRFMLRRDAPGPGAGSRLVYRDTHRAVGTVDAHSGRYGGTLEVTVEPPREVTDEDASPWEGMSGAAVFAGGALVAVVCEHHRPEGANRITARPVEGWYALAPRSLADLRSVLDLLPVAPGDLAVVSPGVRLHGDAPDRHAGSTHRLAELVKRQVLDEVAMRGLLDLPSLPILWEVVGGEARGRVASAAGLRLEEIAELFTAFERPRLVALGEPGSGKSTLAMMLTLRLLEVRESQAPVPVPVSPDRWDPGRDHLRAWFARWLEQRYPQVDREHGVGTLRDLVESGRVFPVFDGLDEAPREVRFRALYALAHGLALRDAVILTSREFEYEDVARYVDWQPGLVLHARSLEALDACRYLADNSAAPQRWRPVADRVCAEPDGPLAHTLASPLLVGLARTAYENPTTHPAHLADQVALPDLTALRHHLLDSLVPAAFSGAPPPTVPVHRRWDPQRAEVHLRFLARRVTRLGQRDLNWWQLAPRSVVNIGWLVGCLLVIALCSGFDLLAAPPHDFGPLTAWGLSALLVAVFGFVCYMSWLLDRFVCALFITADDRWARRPALAATAVCVLVGLITLGAVFTPDGAGGTDLGIIVLGGGGYRVLRGKAGPARIVHATERLHDERRFTMIFALYLLALTSAVDIALAIAMTGRAAVAVELSVCFAFGAPPVLLAALATPWGRWQIGRTVLALAGRLPWRTQAFLDDTRALGVLRIMDGHYQFRHAALQNRLAARSRRHRRARTCDHEAANVSGVPTEISWHRGLPWRRSPKWHAAAWVILVPINVILMGLADLPGVGGVATGIAAVELLSAPGPLISGIFSLMHRSHYLGRSIEVAVTAVQIEVTTGSHRIQLTADQVARLSARRLENARGRPTKYLAIQALIHDGVVLPPGTRVSREGWVTVIPLDPLHRITPALATALEAFAGPRWEPPAFDL